MNKKILFVLPRKPWPPYAGQVRLAYSRALEMKKYNIEVSLICIGWDVKNCIKTNKQNLEKAFCKVHYIEANLFDYLFSFIKAVWMTVLFRRPLQIYIFSSPFITSKFKKYLKQNSFELIHFYSARTFCFWEIVDKANIKFVIDLVDSLTLNLSNKIKYLKGISKIIWINESITARNFELSLPHYSNCISILTVSKIDSSYLKISHNGKPKNKNIPIRVSNIGVNIPKNIKILPTKKNNQIIFFGSLWYEPNLNACFWLMREIMPLLKKKVPNINLLIAGANPAKKLLKEVKKDKQVYLISNPKSLNKFIQESSLCVAPMLSGSGQQFKLIESLALNTPVITTSKGAKPLGLINNKQALIRDSKESFAKAIVEFLKDKELRSNLSKNGFKFVYSKYSWEKIVAELINECYKK